MILKVLDYKQGKDSVYEEWSYFDNIVSASTYYDEGDKSEVVRCDFRDGSLVTIAVPYCAYLMSDTGKTIEKIVPADVEELGNGEDAVYTLQEAVSIAKEESIS